MIPEDGLTRRQAVHGLAWSVPIITLAVAVPAVAASMPALSARLLTAGVGGPGFDFVLRDGKFNNGSVNVSPTNTIVVTATLRIVDAGGVGVPAATVDVSGDEVKDGQGNYLIGISPVETTGTITQSPIKRTVSSVTGANGDLLVKISTSTYGLGDCGSIPRGGIITVTFAKAGFTGGAALFRYQIFDGLPLVACPPAA